MGNCSILINKNLLASLLLNYYDDGQVIINKAIKWGDNDNLYYCDISSINLPEGYHGMQDIIIDLYTIKFKLDVDV